MAESAIFRFDADSHTYIDATTGEERPHITGMLEYTGWIDDRWFTEESSTRGTAVHSLTADYDHGALDVATCRSKYRGWLLAHVAAMASIRPTWTAIEIPHLHPVYRFGGRPDRVGLIFRGQGVLEVKSGDRPSPARPLHSLASSDATSHQIQTALQVLLESDVSAVPPESWLRFALYLKDNGKFKLEEHKDRRDFDEARRIIRVCC